MKKNNGTFGAGALVIAYVIADELELQVLQIGIIGRRRVPSGYR